MARVIRGNVVLHVDERDVQYYIDQGYNYTDEAGNVIKSAIPNNVGVLQQLYVEHTRKIAELEAEIASLKAPKKSTKKSSEG